MGGWRGIRTALLFLTLVFKLSAEDLPPSLSERIRDFEREARLGRAEVLDALPFLVRELQTSEQKSGHLSSLESAIDSLIERNRESTVKRLKALLSWSDADLNSLLLEFLESDHYLPADDESLRLKERDYQVVMASREARAKELRPRATLCRLRDLQANWKFFLKKYSSPLEHRGEWDRAMISLGLWFLLRSEPLCGSQGALPPFHMDFFLSDFLESLELARPNPREGGPARLYGESLESFLLTHLSQSSRYAAFQKRAQRLLEYSQTKLEGFAGKIDESSKSVLENSLMNTYALSFVTLATKEPGNAISRLRAMEKKLSTPLAIPYSPSLGGPQRTSERSASGRAVPFYLALYRQAQDPASRDHYREWLLKALSHFIKNSPSLRMHLRQNKTHIGDDSLAPYYFFPNMAFATAAITELLKDPGTRKEQKQRALSAKEDLKIILLSTLESDGYFVESGSTLYPDSRFYNSMLAGLALVPLVDGESFGILNTP